MRSRYLPRPLLESQNAVLRALERPLDPLSGPGGVFLGMAETTKLSWDWKSSPSEAELRTVLKPFGVRVYRDPACEGSDAYGYIFADRDLTPEELKAAAEDE